MMNMGKSLRDRATHEPSLLHVSARWVGIAFAALALAACNQGTVQNNGECIYIPTGERFVVKAGTQALISGSNISFDVTGADGFVRRMNSEDSNKWKCRKTEAA